MVEDKTVRSGREDEVKREERGKVEKEWTEGF